MARRCHPLFLHGRVQGYLSEYRCISLPPHYIGQTRAMTAIVKPIVRQLSKTWSLTATYFLIADTPGKIQIIPKIIQTAFRGCFVRKAMGSVELYDFRRAVYRKRTIARKA